jgi:quercetin dioxygenase-like cupin family protein
VATFKSLAPEGLLVREVVNTPAQPELSVATCIVEPGVTTALHSLGVKERVRVLEGRGVYELDGERRQIKRGDIVEIAPGVRQRVTNTARDELVLVCTCTPRFTAARYTRHAAAIRR